MDGVLSTLEWAWPYIVTGLNIAAVAIATIDIVQRKREVRAAIGWMGLVWFSPFLGVVLYWFLGINRVERKAAALSLSSGLKLPRQVSFTESEQKLEEKFLEVHPGLAHGAVMIEKLTSRKIMPGNSIESLVDGDEAYPAMIEAIDKAQYTVNLLSYIFDYDRTGRKFADALEAAVARGVDVRVLVDDVGSRYGKPNIVGQLRRRKIRCERFLPTRMSRLLRYANMRNHRKILVVDGKVAFTGGTNIRDDHCLSFDPVFPVRCLHFRFEGPVVEHLQEVFALDWMFTTNEALTSDQFFPVLERSGDIFARGIASGPDESLDTMTMTLFNAVSAARYTVQVVTPYFLPDQPLMQALIAAALRGVVVDVVIPQVNNIRFVEWAIMATIPHLVERGVRVHLSPPPFDHTKLAVVDGLWYLVGSTNWDPRSLRLNFEFNVECFSADAANALHGIIEQRVEEGTQVSINFLKNRPLPVRVRDGLARLLSPYL